MPFFVVVWFAIGLACLCLMPASAENAQDIQSLDSITAAVRAFLSAAQTGETTSPIIVVDALDSRLRLAACGIPLEVSLSPGSRSSGRTVVAVHCSSPHPWSLYVPAKVSVPVFVVVASRSISRDQVITAADISVEKRDAGDLSGSFLTDPNQLIGKAVTRLVTAGAVIAPDQVQSVRLIHRGDRVTLVAQGEGLAVRSVGVALADAGVGERVSVRNESSRRVVEGVVNKEGLVVTDW